MGNIWEKLTAASPRLEALIAFRNSLKLIHWSITGKGSYEVHLSLDQAIDSLVDITDRLVETTFALEGALEIVIPETTRPKDYILICLA